MLVLTKKAREGKWIKYPILGNYALVGVFCIIQGINYTITIVIMGVDKKRPLMAIYDKRAPAESH